MSSLPKGSGSLNRRRRHVLQYSGMAPLLDEPGPITPLYGSCRVPGGVPPVEKYSQSSASPFAPPGSSGSSARGGRLSPEDLQMIAEIIGELDAIKWAKRKMQEEMGGGASLPAENGGRGIDKAAVTYSRSARDREAYSKRMESLRDPGGRSCHNWDERQRLELAEIERYAKHQESIAGRCEQARKWALLYGKSWEEAAARFGIVPVGPPASS